MVEFFLTLTFAFSVSMSFLFPFSSSPPVYCIPPVCLLLLQFPLSALCLPLHSLSLTHLSLSHLSLSFSCPSCVTEASRCRLSDLIKTPGLQSGFLTLLLQRWRLERSGGTALSAHSAVIGQAHSSRLPSSQPQRFFWGGELKA